MIYGNDGELSSDILFHLAVTYNATGEGRDTLYGRNFWIPINEAIRNEKSKRYTIQPLVTLLRKLKKVSASKIPLFYTEDVHID